MKKLSHLAVAALAMFLVQAKPQTAQAAFAPTAIGSAIERAGIPQVEEVRRGGGGRGMRGGGRHFGGGFRGGGRHFGGGFRGGRWGHGGGRRHWGGGRRHWGGWGGIGWGFGAAVPLGYYGYSCIRRGWVWNGYRYVWRRYRVC